jgi:protein-disulfide isomerase-like protein with CxxC motif
MIWSGIETMFGGLMKMNSRNLGGGMRKLVSGEATRINEATGVLAS